MKSSKFDFASANRHYDNALKRTEWTGPRATMGTVLHLARENGYEAQVRPSINAMRFDLAAGIPRFEPHGVLPRQFAGVTVDERSARLFPLSALSVLVALGAVGKTTFCVAVACHVAAGKDWNGTPVTALKVMMFCVEEMVAEINAKISACIFDWPEDVRNKCIRNLCVFSCLDGDYRLTKIDRNQYVGTGVADEMIAAIDQFGASLVIIDHLQGFASGDLNGSETATAMAREANKIVAATGAAVVLTAHISKANIGAQSVQQGFISGSLAFENAARQMVGLIPMPDADAKRFGVEAMKSEYLKLEIPKNSYGPSGAGMYLRRMHQPSYHTVRIEPVSLTEPLPAVRQSAHETLCEKVIDYIKRHPDVTKNKLDAASGADGFFRASKVRVRAALDDLLKAGNVVMTPVTEVIRSRHQLGKQVKHLLEVAK